MNEQQRAAMLKMLDALEVLVQIDQFTGGSWEKLTWEAISAGRETLQEDSLQTLSDIHQEMERSQGAQYTGQIQYYRCGFVAGFMASGDGLNGETIGEDDPWEWYQFREAYDGVTPPKFRRIEERIAELEQNPERKAALDKARERLHHIANAGKMMPNLWPVINWLENGCDPKEAAKELRIYESQRQNHSGEATDMVQEPVLITDGMAYAFHSALTDGPLGADEIEEIKIGLRAAFANTAQPTVPNLNCKSVQRRLATSWGYVRKEEYGMAKVAAATAMRDSAVKVCRDIAQPVGAGMMSDFQWAATGCAEAIAALPLPGEDK